MRINSVVLITLTIFSLLSCSKDDDQIATKGNFENGVLISHEGTFSGVSGSVSYVSDDFSTVENNIFNAVNGEDLGIFQQSIGFKGDLAFIVVDVANSITVVNRYTFEKVATITDRLENPRYIAFDDNNKAYVTNWGDPFISGDDYIAIIDLSDYSVNTDVVSVADGPEQIVYRDGSLYVSHKGGYGVNNIVSLFQTSNFGFTTREVGDKPDEMVFDAAGDLWVLTEGNTVYDQDFNIVSQTPGSLVKMSGATIDRTINFTGTDQPSLMTYANGKVYYMLNGAIYAMDETSTTLPSNPIITGSFYGMTIIDQYLYAVDAGDFASNGTLKVFDLTTNEEVESITVGVVPAKIYAN